MFDNFTRHELEIIDILEWNEVSEILAYKFVKSRYVPKGELLDFLEFSYSGQGYIALKMFNSFFEFVPKKNVAEESDEFFKQIAMRTTVYINCVKDCPESFKRDIKREIESSKDYISVGKYIWNHYQFVSGTNTGRKVYYIVME